MATALSLTFGRSGALLGNLLIGFLIDLNCVVPIFVFSTTLTGMKIQSLEVMTNYLKINLFIYFFSQWLTLLAFAINWIKRVGVDEIILEN